MQRYCYIINVNNNTKVRNKPISSIPEILPLTLSIVKSEVKFVVYAVTNSKFKIISSCKLIIASVIVSEAIKIK